MAIRVLLTDDHKMLREGIKQLLEFDTDIIVSAQASTGSECLADLSSDLVDVVVLDINLPDCSGIDLLKEIKGTYPGVKVLMLTLHDEIEYLVDSVDAGADGYILKESGSDMLISAIRHLYKGEQFIQPNLIPSLNARLLKRDNEKNRSRDITKREKQMLNSIALGKTNKDIAEEYDISERTVKAHVTHILQRLGVADRTQAALWAERHSGSELLPEDA